MTQTFKRFWMASCLMLGLSLTLAPMAPAMADTTPTNAEAMTSIDFWGQLQELSSTTAPTTIIVRKDPTGSFTDYTVAVESYTGLGTASWNTTSMDDWITGDTLHVIGTLDENTGVVTAAVIVNSSMNPAAYLGLNGWITSIDTSASTMTVQWNNVDHVVHVTSNTHMVVPPTNPAGLGDFKIGDRVRVRLIKGSSVENEARIIVALRRGDQIFLKARTRGFNAQLDSISENSDGTGTLTMTLLSNPDLRSGDVNNLIGVEGDQVTVNYDSNTDFVRRFNGKTDASELVEGDSLFVVGRKNDDGTIGARLIKDVNIWVLGVVRHAGIVQSIDTSTNTMVLTPKRDEDSTDATSISVTYDSSTVFREGGDAASENDVAVGDVVHVRGTAHEAGGVLTIGSVKDIAIQSSSSGSSSGSGSDDTGDTSETGQPDLTVSSISDDGGNLKINVTNDGASLADGQTFDVAIWLNDVLAYDYSSATLSDQDARHAGGTTTIEPVTLTGETTVKVCADNNGTIAESNETNNCLTETVGS